MAGCAEKEGVVSELKTKSKEASNGLPSASQSNHLQSKVARIASFSDCAFRGRFQVRRRGTYHSCSAPLQSTRSQARRRRRRSCRETVVVGVNASNQGSRRQCRANPRWLLLLLLVLVLVPVLVLLCAFDRRAALCLASSRELSPLVSGMAYGGFKIGFSPLRRSRSSAAAKRR